MRFLSLLLLLLLLLSLLLLLLLLLCQSGLSNHYQLHKSSVPSDIPVLACCLKDCIEDAAEWMGDSKLKINDKT